MPSVINTNNASLVAQRNLSNSQAHLTTSVQRLSSGLRINSSKDDAAGLGISQVLQAQVSGSTISARNANDAISMVQTAEGGIQEVSTMLQRMRVLAVQGNNSSLSVTQMTFIGTEVNALRDEINKITTRTTFNGKTLLDGSQSTEGCLVFQTGTAATDTADISLLMQNVTLTTLTGATFTEVNAATASSSDSSGAATSVGALLTTLTSAIDVACGTGSDAAGSFAAPTAVLYGSLVTAIDGGINAISSVRSSMGAMQNRLEHNIANLAAQTENLTASMSRIRDTDYSEETAQLTKHQVMQQAATAMLAQANQMPNVVLSLLK
jgi:flagellin